MNAAGVALLSDFCVNSQWNKMISQGKFYWLHLPINICGIFNLTTKKMNGKMRLTSVNGFFSETNPFSKSTGVY